MSKKRSSLSLSFFVNKNSVLCSLVPGSVLKENEHLKIEKWIRTFYWEHVIFVSRYFKTKRSTWNIEKLSIARITKRGPQFAKSVIELSRTSIIYRDTHSLYTLRTFVKENVINVKKQWKTAINSPFTNVRSIRLTLRCWGNSSIPEGRFSKWF